MKKFISALLALTAVLLVAGSPSYAAESKLKNNLRVTGNLQVDGTSIHTGATTQTGNFAVAGNQTVGGTQTVTGVATFTADPVFSAGTVVKTSGNQTIAGAKTFSTPITAASINEGVKRQSIVLNFKGGDVLTNGVTYVQSAPMRRAGTVKAICVSAHTRMAGGTNTLALAKKQGGTSVTLLSTATVDPTAVPSAADTAQALTLTATGADLVFAAGDCLKSTLACGTMTTDGQGYAVTIDVEYTDI